MAEAAALVRLAIWKRMPARTAGPVLQLPEAFLAALTLGDCLTLTLAATALHHGIEPAAARATYARTLSPQSFLVRHEHLLVNAVLRTPALLAL